MVKCPRCGYENNSKSTYCVNCTYLLRDPNRKKAKKSSSSNHKLKNITILILIIIMFIIIFSMIYNFNDNSSDSSSIITSNATGTKFSSTPFVYQIEYNGSWVVQSGKTGNMDEFYGSGNFDKRLNCVAWDHIFIKVSKTDSSSNPLRLIVYKNGKVLFDKTTTATDGTIQYELNT